MLHLQRTGELCADQAIPVCNNPLTTNAAFDFLVGLCVSCVPNMKLLVHMLTDMFYSGLFISVIVHLLILHYTNCNETAEWNRTKYTGCLVFNGNKIKHYIF
jgi:hypothetical protein